MRIFGCFSLVVCMLHAAWKWGGAGGTSYIGTVGTVGPAYFGALLLWPTWIASCICAIAILFRRAATPRWQPVILLFIPLIIYGCYFLVAGGWSERAGLR